MVDYTKLNKQFNQVIEYFNRKAKESGVPKLFIDMSDIPDSLRFIASNKYAKTKRPEINLWINYDICAIIDPVEYLGIAHPDLKELDQDKMTCVQAVPLLTDSLGLPISGLLSNYPLYGYLALGDEIDGVSIFYLCFIGDRIREIETWRNDDWSEEYKAFHKNKVPEVLKGKSKRLERIVSGDDVRKAIDLAFEVYTAN
jgi:hypothetical protein